MSIGKQGPHERAFHTDLFISDGKFYDTAYYYETTRTQTKNLTAPETYRI
jgi:hypothetical protein